VSDVTSFIKTFLVVNLTDKTCPFKTLLIEMETFSFKLSRIVKLGRFSRDSVQSPAASRSLKIQQNLFSWLFCILYLFIAEVELVSERQSSACIIKMRCADYLIAQADFETASVMLLSSLENMALSCRVAAGASAEVINVDNILQSSSDFQSFGSISLVSQRCVSVTEAYEILLPESLQQKQQFKQKRYDKNHGGVSYWAILRYWLLKKLQLCFCVLDMKTKYAQVSLSLLSLSEQACFLHLGLEVHHDKLLSDIIEITKVGQVVDTIGSSKLNDSLTVVHSFHPFFESELICIENEDNCSLGPILAPCATSFVGNITLFEETYRYNGLNCQAGNDNKILLKLKSNFKIPLKLSVTSENNDSCSSPDIFVVGYGQDQSVLKNSLLQSPPSNKKSIMPHDIHGGMLLSGFRASEDLILSEKGFYAYPCVPSHHQESPLEQFECTIFPGEQIFSFTLKPKRPDDFVPLFIVVSFFVFIITNLLFIPLRYFVSS
jgi:hypothetical protein